MFQTIIQFDVSQYPFDVLQQQSNLKLETLVQCANSTDFIENKKKFQILKSLRSPTLIALDQIFQQSLTFHLIYEHISASLRQHVHRQIAAYREGDLLGFKKQFLQKMYMQLIELTQCLKNSKILTYLKYDNFGVQIIQQKQNRLQIKYFIGSDLQLSEHAKQLQQFYLSERKKILCLLEQDLQMEKRPDCLPNFIIKGNRLVFTDELSQTKTRKRRSQSPQRAARKQYKNYAKPPKYGKSSAKPKKQHKYSCNFEQQNLNFEFDNDQLNKSVESEDNQGYSITKTRSMKIEVQHQKPTKKNRKNSVKFKITTFEEISIDQSIDEDGKNGEQGQQKGFQFPQNTPSQPANTCKENKEDKKDYKQKVKQAKKKAEALLTQYMKVKNKSCYK